MQINNFLLRLVSARIYDEASLAVIQRTCHQIVLPSLPRRIAALPIQHGCTFWNNLADCAFVASYQTSAKAFPTYFPKLAHLIPDVTTLYKPGQVLTTAPSQLALSAARATLRLTHYAPATFEQLSMQTKNTRHLQFCISSAFADRSQMNVLEKISVIDDPRHPRHTALFWSNTGDVHFFRTLPTNQTQATCNELFEIIVARRILQPTTNFSSDAHQQNSQVLLCPSCHVTSVTNAKNSSVPQVDIYGDHAIRCKGPGGLRTEWHDNLV